MRAFILSLVALSIAVLCAPYARACDHAQNIVLQEVVDDYCTPQIRAVRVQRQVNYVQPVVQKVRVEKVVVQQQQKVQKVLAVQDNYGGSANVLQLNSGRRGNRQLNLAVNSGDRVRFRRGLLGERLKIN